MNSVAELHMGSVMKSICISLYTYIYKSTPLLTPLFINSHFKKYNTLFFKNMIRPIEMYDSLEVKGEGRGRGPGVERRNGPNTVCTYE
jgi:hypothetical protein